MSDGVGESHRFPPIDGLHDRCCNISNERCRRAPLEFIKSPSPRYLSAKPASAFISGLSLHTFVLELLICNDDFIPRELLVRPTDQDLYRSILTYTNPTLYTSSLELSCHFAPCLLRLRLPRDTFVVICTVLPSIVDSSRLLDRGNFPGLLARLTISPEFIPPILSVSRIVISSHPTPLSSILFSVGRLGPPTLTTVAESQ